MRRLKDGDVDAGRVLADFTIGDILARDAGGGRRPRTIREKRQ